MRGNFRDDLSVMQHAHQAIFGDAPDFHRVEAPLREYGEHFLLAAALGHQQHALLRFAEHHFVGRHAGFALRHARQLDLDAQAAARRHLARRTGEPRRAHVLNRDDRAGLHRFEARLEQQLFHERVAHLHVGPLLLRFFGEFRGGQQRRAVNAVAAGFCADINHRIARAARLREKQVFFFRDAERQHVHQRIGRIARLELHFAADGWHAEAIAVMRDAAHHAVEDAPVARDRFFIDRFRG